MPDAPYSIHCEMTRDLAELATDRSTAPQDRIEKKKKKAKNRVKLRDQEDQKSNGRRISAITTNYHPTGN